MPATLAVIKRLVERAEECRVLAGMVGDEKVAKGYLQLADTYELLAEVERGLSAAREGKQY